jgi:hypothetical protein
MKLDFLTVCCALHNRSLKDVKENSCKKCFAGCGFPVDHVSSNGDKALKLTEHEGHFSHLGV